MKLLLILCFFVIANCINDINAGELARQNPYYTINKNSTTNIVHEIATLNKWRVTGEKEEHAIDITNYFYFDALPTRLRIFPRSQNVADNMKHIETRIVSYAATRLAGFSMQFSARSMQEMVPAMQRNDQSIFVDGLSLPRVMFLSTRNFALQPENLPGIPESELLVWLDFDVLHVIRKLESGKHERIMLDSKWADRKNYLLLCDEASALLADSRFALLNNHRDIFDNEWMDEIIARANKKHKLGIQYQSIVNWQIGRGRLR